MPRCCRRYLAFPQELVLQISSLSVSIFPSSQPSTVALLNEITQDHQRKEKKKKTYHSPNKGL